MKMTEKDLLELFDKFINEQGLVTDFMEFLDEQGYSESEYDEVMEPNS